MKKIRSSLTFYLLVANIFHANSVYNKILTNFLMVAYE